MRNTLYLIAGSRNIQNDEVSFANVGETRRTVEERIKDADYSRKAAGGKWLILGRWDIGEHCDKDVHRIMRSHGEILNPDNTTNTEELLCNRTVDRLRDDIDKYVNELLHGVKRPDSFQMRPEQVSCVDKVTKYFQSGGTRFLIDAKMRFGKTHVAYQIVQHNTFKNVLILTYKPAVLNEWQQGCERHVDFVDLKFNLVENSPSTGVTFSSMQRLLSNDKRESSTCTWIYDIDWDLVILDEEHYGTRTDSASCIFDRLRTRHWLHLSGTPFQARLGNEFDENATFVWAYNDEKRAKIDWIGAPESNPYILLPDLEWHTYDFSDLIKCRTFNLYNEDEGFRLSKLFAASNNKLINESDVLEFLDILAGRSTSVRNMSPWTSSKIRRNYLNHTLWILPSSVESVHALANVMSRHSWFSQFEIIDVAGDGGDDGETRIEDAHRRIRLAEIDRRRTITLSAGRFTTGVTVPEWGAVFFLDDGRSPSSYFQAAFRAQNVRVTSRHADSSPAEWKRTCYAIDFSPHRLLEMVYNLAASTKDKTTSARDAVSTWLDCAPIYKYGEVQLTMLDVDDVMNVAVTSKNFVDRFSSGYFIDTRAVSNDDMSDVIAKLLKLGREKTNALRKQITDAGIARGKNKKQARDKQAKHVDSDKNLEKKLNELREKTQTFLKTFPTFLYVSERVFGTCQDVIQSGDSELFERHTELTINDFKIMLECGYLCEDHLDNCITGLNELRRNVSMLLS